MNKLIALLFLLSACRAHDGFIYTVNGKINSENLNFTLTHEHIMSNFGADQSYLATYDRDSLFNQVIPYLKNIKSKGVFSILDCTTAYFGRDVRLLKALADSTGIQIITNTGFYGAANDRYVPQIAFASTAEQIAKLWIEEFKNGIDQTTIKPGFVKLAFDEGIPSDIDLKLFKAGILTHLSTGLTLAVHTGNNPEAAHQQLNLLQEHSVSPAAWVWVHANKIDDQKLLVDAALKGAWISLDGINESNMEEYIQKIQAFRTYNLLHKILLSHDGNSYPRGGPIRSYDVIPDILVPRLTKLGYSMEEINQLMIKNPQEAFMIRVRTLKE